MNRFIPMLALLCVTTMAFPQAVRAQAAPAKSASASTYLVVAGDDVPGIVRKLKYADVTESQMYYAVVQTNMNTFSVNTVERVTPGMRLTIPSQAEVKKIDVKTADTYMANLRKAEIIYQEGVTAEKGGDMKTAMEKYLESAKIGHAVASVKLGQLYDKGVTKTLPRDLQESIKNYQSARERGRAVKGPGSRAPTPTN